MINALEQAEDRVHSERVASGVEGLTLLRSAYAGCALRSRSLNDEQSVGGHRYFYMLHTNVSTNMTPSVPTLGCLHHQIARESVLLLSNVRFSE